MKPEFNEIKTAVLDYKEFRQTVIEKLHEYWNKKIMPETGAKTYPNVLINIISYNCIVYLNSGEIIFYYDYVNKGKSYRCRAFTVYDDCDFKYKLDEINSDREKYNKFFDNSDINFLDQMQESLNDEFAKISNEVKKLIENKTIKTIKRGDLIYSTFKETEMPDYCHNVKWMQSYDRKFCANTTDVLCNDMAQFFFHNVNSEIDKD